MSHSSITDFDLGGISRFQGRRQEYLHELVNEGDGGGVRSYPMTGHSRPAVYFRSAPQIALRFDGLCSLREDRFMSEPWSKIAAFYRQFPHGGDDDAYWLACCEIGSLASAISQSRIDSSMFGWTSMHDLCIQQRDIEPFSGPYLRIAPMHSGRVDFRLIDTPIAARQWHREVDAVDTTKRFAGFLAQIKWVDQGAAASLLSRP